MALPNGSNTPPISLADINTEFGLGSNLNAYRGQLWGDYSNHNSGLFPSGTVSFSDFYGKSIVTPSSTPTTFSASGTFTVKPYRTLTIVIKGGSGGGSGGNGNATGGGAGTNGASSTFGSYATGDFGRSGGSGGSSGTGSDGTPAGGSAGGSGGYTGATNGTAGGASGKTTVTLTNPVLGGSGPTSGTGVSVTIGSGGSGGSAGTGVWYPPPTFTIQAYTCGTGGNGSAGNASITWTGQ